MRILLVYSAYCLCGNSIYLDGENQIFYPKLDVDIYVYMYLHLSEFVCFLVALACFAESKLSPVLIFELLNSQV